jgi:hypothetical protein
MKEGTFLVTNADEATAVVTDVHDQQVHTIDDAPDLDDGEVLEATIEPVPPMEVTWQIVEIESRYDISVDRSPERPTTQERDLAAHQNVGEVTRRERAGIGEIHVLTVPDDRTDQAATDVLEDEATLAMAARLGVERVEVRADAGVVSVRYLPDARSTNQDLADSSERP